MSRLLFIFISLLMISCNGQETKNIDKKLNTRMNNLEQITFGGGCFWCVESCFNMLKGVESAVSGYSGGHKENPTYEEVCTGETGHAEVVQITYDSSIISYEQLMEVFFFLHDPTQLNRQGNDIGTQYRSVIFYRDEAEKARAEKALEVSKTSGKWHGEYVTELAPFEKFWSAEQYHQGYYNENPTQPYCSTVVGPKIAKFKEYFGKKGWLK
ncbi:MAG: peptide-methionine (S)-S-oxide reductase MsrA [Bergeyella sp.]